MISMARLRKQRLTIAVLLALVVCAAILSAGIGYSSLSFQRLLPTLFGQGTFKEEFVLFSVRLPRIAITVLAGMALALSGAILQGVTRNDLADPGIIGINAGAGASIALFFLFAPIDAASFAYALPLVGFAGAMAAALLIYAFSFRRHVGLQPVRLVLVGVGVSAALSGAMIVLISSAEREKADFIARWIAGNIWGDDWPFVWALLPWLLALTPLVLSKANRLNLLSLGDPVAVGVGLRLNRERATLLLAAVALAASAVSVTGGIAFIGLLAPHIARGLVGPRHQAMLPTALLIGGLLLLAADTIGRIAAEPQGIAAGVVVALIGAPYFVYLLIRK